jgi:hypothetical protein
MNAQQVWQAQAIDAPRISLAYVRHVASEFERRRRLRAGVGYVLMLGACGLHVFSAWHVVATKPLAAAGSGCIVIALLFCIYRLHRHMTAEASPADAGVLDVLRFQRRRLERQRDWRRGSWRWVFPAILPGYLLVMASLYFENDPVPWKRMAFSGLVMIVAFVLSIVSGERKARRSQREIDALDSLARYP